MFAINQNVASLFCCGHRQGVFICHCLTTCRVFTLLLMVSLLHVHHQMFCATSRVNLCGVVSVFLRFGRVPDSFRFIWLDRLQSQRYEPLCYDCIGGRPTTISYWYLPTVCAWLDWGILLVFSPVVSPVSSSPPPKNEPRISVWLVSLLLVVRRVYITPFVGEVSKVQGGSNMTGTICV
jgi:hypothetical protein